MTGRRHVCPGAGCGRGIARWQRLCDSCFRRLPADLQRGLAAANAARDALKRAALVRDAVAWLAAPPPSQADRVTGEAPP